MRGHDVLTPDHIRFGLLDVVGKLGEHGTHLELDLFGGRQAHPHAVLTAEVFGDILGDLVARDADAVGSHDAAQRDDCDLGGTATDVHDHVALRCEDVETDAEGACHRLVYEIHLPAAGML